MKITIVGAGKTGRGYLARLLAGNELTFIDKNADLVAALNAAGRVRIEFFGGKAPTAEVGFRRALTWDEVERIDADLILVSVGGPNLADVGERLKKFVSADTPIIVCENYSAPAKKLRDAIGIEGIKVAESTVFCTTIEGEGVDIRSEWYPYLQYDAGALPGLKEVTGLKGIENFGGFLDRKLFTYNSASCIIAYLGYQLGYTVYSDAANDARILDLLDKNYARINRCICKEYGYDEADQDEFARLSRDKFTDRTIADTVARNAREPQRKITPRERVVAPLLLEEKYGEDSSVLEATLAAMLLYTPEEETEWRRILYEKGYEGVLTECAGLTADSPVFERVLKMAKSRSALGLEFKK